MPIMRNLTPSRHNPEEKVYFPAANFFDLAQFGASTKEGENSVYPVLLCLATWIYRQNFICKGEFINFHYGLCSFGLTGLNFEVWNKTHFRNLEYLIIYYFGKSYGNLMIQRFLSLEHFSWFLIFESLSFYWYHGTNKDFKSFRGWVSFQTLKTGMKMKIQFEMTWISNIFLCQTWFLMFFET